MMAAGCRRVGQPLRNQKVHQLLPRIGVGKQKPADTVKYHPGHRNKWAGLGPSTANGSYSPIMDHGRRDLTSKEMD
jgi:hypothetical protein